MFPRTEIEESDKLKRNQDFREIPIEHIRPNKYDLRPLDLVKIDELAVSVASQGLLQRPVVRTFGKDTYELVFGLHRLEACKKLSWEKIPVEILNLTEEEAFLTALTENLQRNNWIDPVAEARGFQNLVDKDWTGQKIGSSIGKTQQYVSARLSLLKLDEKTRQLVTSRLVNPEHAYELSKIDDLKKRSILATLSRTKAINLQELRDMSRMNLEKLRNNPRVIEMMPPDPNERINKLEERIESIDNLTKELHIFFKHMYGQNKMEHCEHNINGGCASRKFDEIPEIIKKYVDFIECGTDGDEKHFHPKTTEMLCASCPFFKDKCSNTNIKPDYACSR